KSQAEHSDRSLTDAAVEEEIMPMPEPMSEPLRALAKVETIDVLLYAPTDPI
ncbi:unnamed protein product, partial [Amoebophrya sp. A25]